MRRLKGRSAAQGRSLLAETGNWSHRVPLLVIDIEVRIDELARRLSRSRTTPTTSDLREISCVSCLSWDEACVPAWRLTSFHRDEMSEADILENAHELAAQNFSRSGVLATYNGQAHDLPLLRSRQVRWWQCDRGAFASYLSAQAEHFDVMKALASTRRTSPSLVNACASMGVPLHGATRMEADRDIPEDQEKCERDVTGTAILYFYALADALRSNEPILWGLSGLGTFLAEAKLFRPHLSALANNPTLKQLKGPWGRPN